MKRATADDVARASGVSRATVSFVLNDTPGQTISAPVRERVQSEASRLGYIPHPHARALASGQTHLILVLLPDRPVEYLTRQLLDEASSVLDNAGYSLVTVGMRLSGHATPLWETLRPDVVIPFELPHPKEVEAIRRSGVRLVLPDPLMHPSFDQGPELQMRHLLELGHRSLAYAGTSVHGMKGMDRDRFVRTKALAESHGIDFTSDVIDSSNARDIVARWVNSRVTAVVAFNDETAARVVAGAYYCNVSVPTQLAVIGHDNSPFSTLIAPSLSTVAIDASGLGRHLAYRALAIARGEPEPPAVPPDFEPRLIKREST